MSNVISTFDQDKQKRLEEIAQELSSYGLGIFLPHAHDSYGNAVPLPNCLISYEENLRVRFVLRELVPVDAVPVGWRWSNGAMVPCAKCCHHAPEKT